MLKKSAAAFAALSLAASPVLAQSATSLSVQPAMERAGAPMDESSELAGGNLLVPAIAAVIVVLGILLATETWPFDRDPRPVSP